MSFHNTPNNMENYETYKYKLGYCLKNENYDNHAGFDRYDDMTMFIQNLNQDGLSYRVWNSKGEKVETYPKIDLSKIKKRGMCYWCIECFDEDELNTFETLDTEDNTICNQCCETEEFKEFLENNNIANSV